MNIRFVLMILIVHVLSACSVDEHPQDCKEIQKTVGLIKNTQQAFPGYTLFSPSLSKTAYLIDNEGRYVHTWTSEYITSSSYLLPNGHLLRNALFGKMGGHVFGRHGSIRQIEEYNWDGDLVWHYALSDDKFQLHHDIAPLPNGNILAIVWERQTKQQAIAAGRDPALLKLSEHEELWPDAIIEIKPDYNAGSGGTIVWQWHLKDHVVQDFDASKPNYMGPDGVKQHPERVNLNFISTSSGANSKRADWTHFNAIDYNPQTDHIMLSSREFSEFWIIDHGITTEEAAGPKGDLLYRFGNPQAYHQGTEATRQLFFQHDAQWIKEGLPGAGHVLVFSNGAIGDASHEYSEALEIAPDMGNYGQGVVVWKYQGSPQEQFYSPVISGVQRLPNGNTLIDEGTKGNFWEVSPQGDIVWHYINPDSKSIRLTQGDKVPREYFLPISNLYANLVFRATRYPVTYPAFIDKVLAPQGTIEHYACHEEGA